MSTPVLTTKLHIPTLRSALVPRPRLLERLNSGLERSLTPISAPAGFGKSTLLSTWVQAIAMKTPPVAVAWFSLDSEDDEYGRFWMYVIAALQTAHVGLGQTTLRHLQTPSIPPVSTSLTLLLNDIAAHAHNIVLVLDDYHLIAASAIHEGVAYILEHRPPTAKSALGDCQPR